MELPTPPARQPTSQSRYGTMGMVIAVIGAIVLAAVYEPAHPVAITPHGDRYTVLDAGRTFGTKGNWTYFNFIAHDTSAFGIDSEVTLLLTGIVVPAAERNGDT